MYVNKLLITLNDVIINIKDLFVWIRNKPTKGQPKKLSD